MNPAEQSRTEQTHAPVPVPVRLWCEACPDGSRFWMEQLPACGTDYGATPFVALSEPAFASLVALLSEARDFKHSVRLGCSRQKGPVVGWDESEGGGPIYGPDIHLTPCKGCEEKARLDDLHARIDWALRGLRGEAGGAS